MISSHRTNKSRGLNYSFVLFLLLFLFNICSTAYVNAESTDNHVEYILEFATLKQVTNFVKEHTKSKEIIRVRQTYESDLFKGVAVEFSDEKVAKSILDQVSILKFWPIYHHIGPQAPSHSQKKNKSTTVTTRFIPENKDTISILTQENNRFENLKSNGTGIKIGIIDSGIDYTHPALGGCFGKGCKVAYGYDLVGNNFDGLPNSIKESSDPIDDCPSNSTSATGHGTFVAGIIAADDKIYNWHGVAPGATLGMWKVYGCNYASSPNDIMLKAMEMAYKAGMDVISISSGVSGGWDESVLSVMADRLVAKGVHVVAGVGNSGTSGIFLTSSPASGEKVISVGSTDNKHAPGYLLELVNPKKSIPYRTFVSSALTLNSTLPIVASGKKFNQANDACKKLTGKKYKNSIVLIHQGGCDTMKKIEHAYHAGAIAVVLYTDIKDAATTYEALTHATLPIAFINNDDGRTVFKAISKKTKARFTNTLVALDTNSASGISYFSTLGPTNELQIKPELVAVGSNVFSTLPSYLKYYGFESGTSFSTPYVAGSVALLLSNTKNTSPDLAKHALMNFAQPVRPPISANPYGDSPIRQGAGVVDVAQAIDGLQQFHVSPAKLSFNDTAHFNAKQHITIHNHHSKALTFHIRHDPSLTANGYSITNESYTPNEPVQLYNGNNSVAKLIFSKSVVTVPAGKSVQIEFTVKPPTIFKPSWHSIYGGFISVSTQNLKANVPYIGMIGNMSDLPILDRTAGPSKIAAFPFPSIGLADGDNTLNGNKTGHFKIKRVKGQKTGMGGLYLIARLLTGTPVLQIQILDAKTNKVVGDVPMTTGTPRKWMLRNTLSITESSTTFTSWYWSGEYVPKDSTLTDKSYKAKVVKSGSYRLKLRGLRVFGNPECDKDWDEWISPKLVLDIDYVK